jgi:hypothetical protein
VLKISAKQNPLLSRVLARARNIAVNVIPPLVVIALTW